MKNLFLLLISLFLLKPALAKSPSGCFDVSACMDRAQQDDPEAQYFLGSELFKSGNYKEALIWFMRAGDQGHAKAQYNVGSMYSKGQGVIVDNKEALIWYSRAAENGDPLSMYNLALLNLYGEGLEENPVAAYEWFLKAAEKGYPSAFYNLAVMHYNGIGAQKSFEQAYAWYHISALYNIADAEKRQELIGLRLAKNTENLERAKKLAQAYQKIYVDPFIQSK